jgi:hypothetical protein
MRINDTELFNKTQYIDLRSKINYLIKKHNFIYDDLEPSYIMKKDMVLHIAILHNYAKEQLDVLNFLANKYFIYDPFIHKGFLSDICSIKFEDMHSFSLKEIRMMYNDAVEIFKSKVTIN